MDTLLVSLRDECDFYDDSEYTSIYDDDEIKIDAEFIENEYCGVLKDGTELLCDTCCGNFEKISSYIDDLDLLRDNWDLPIRDDPKIDKLLLSLRQDCERYSDPWSGHGSIYADDETKIDANFIKHNWCGSTPNCSRGLCDKCRHNFLKIACYLDNLHALIENWNLPIIAGIPSPVQREIQTYEMFKNKNPNFNIDDKWSICEISDHCRNFDDHIEELKKHEIIYLGWGYSGDITVLATLPKLKVLICGYWFSQSLNLLANSSSLEYICVRRSYNRDLIDKIYNITSTPGNQTIEDIIYSYQREGRTYNITRIGSK